MDFLLRKGFAAGNYEHAFGILLKEHKSYWGQSWIAGADLCGRCHAHAFLETKHVVKHLCKYDFVYDNHTKCNVSAMIRLDALAI